jgi:hypothetical protein
MCLQCQTRSPTCPQCGAILREIANVSAMLAMLAMLAMSQRLTPPKDTLKNIASVSQSGVESHTSDGKIDFDPNYKVASAATRLLCCCCHNSIFPSDVHDSTPD